MEVAPMASRLQGRWAAVPAAVAASVPASPPSPACACWRESHSAPAATALSTCAYDMPTPLPVRVATGRSLLLALVCGVASAADALTLPQALQRAQQVNENAAIARERLVQADGAKREAYAELLPTLDLTASYIPWSAQYDPFFDGSMGLSVRLFDPSSIPRVRQASRLVEALRLDADELRRAAPFDTATGFYLVLAADALAL